MRLLVGISFATATCALALILAGALRPGQPARAQDAPVAVILLDMDVFTPGVQPNADISQSMTPILIDVVIQNAQGIGAFEFMVAFDLLALRFDGWTEGPFLSSTGRATACYEIITESSVRVGCSTAGPPPPAGPFGDGVLATLAFIPLRAGTTCVSMVFVESAEIFGTPLPTVGQGGCMTLIPDAPTSTATATVTNTRTATATATNTPTRTSTPALTPTTTPATLTATPTATGTPTPAVFICPLSYGSWKAHPDSWPVTSLVLGDETYSSAELKAILGLAGAADASVILARQLIAAKLNLANQAEPFDVAVFVALADQLLAPLQGKLPYNIAPSSAEGNPMIWVAGALDAYNARCSESAGPGTGSVPGVTPVVTVLAARPPVRPGGLPNVGASGTSADSGGRAARLSGAVLVSGVVLSLVAGGGLSLFLAGSGLRGRRSGPR